GGVRVCGGGRGGGGGERGRKLVEPFQCQPGWLGCEADGIFAHEPEPIAAHLTDVCPRVADSGSHIGLVLDPDADRLALIDETGRYIGEELTLALAVLFRLGVERGPGALHMSTARVVGGPAGGLGVPRP